MRFLSYIWTSKRAKIQLFSAFLFALVFVLWVIKSVSQSMGFPAMWQSWMEPYLAFGTIFLAVFIWVNEQKQDWENNLPKRLDVDFIYDDTVIYQVVNAPLTGSDDVRQWGQQIGMQMNQNRQLKFRGFKVQTAERGLDSNRRYVMRHALTVWLYEVDAETEKKRWVYDDDGNVLPQKELQDVSSITVLDSDDRGSLNV